MSSRALRRIQKEEEERRRAEVFVTDNDNAVSDEDEADFTKGKVANAFDLLNDPDSEDNTDLSDHHEEKEATKAEPLTSSQSQVLQPKKNKKKKKGKKGKGPAVAVAGLGQPKDDNATTEMDEIDLALQSLSAKDKEGVKASTTSVIDEANAQLFRLLAIEAKHLNALNEMKRLFGNVVTENTDDSPANTRRRGRGPQQVDLGGALTARYSPVSKGQGLKGLALKRNPFILGKEEWPQATSGGLGMELVEKMEDGTIEYRFTHSGIYQGVQREFESCVASMDPQRLINMLVFNPYHISTLLQVSEVAKQQGDHSVSGDLLERALFTFGRSVHSSFTNALSEGKARLDFRRPENREFWLTAWRYVKDLGQRGTWRTAYEWAKMILSLDPEGDPYCISKNLDQLAIRGGQSEHFLKLTQHPFFQDSVWTDLPNIWISKSIAEYKLKQPRKCRETLTRAIQHYPWIFVRLFQELNISHIPRSIWGKYATTDREKFESESYALNAKDMWSLPDMVSLLVEVAETAAPPEKAVPVFDRPISLDEARNTLLTGATTLINLLPREYTTSSSRSSDPLPPEDDLPSYDPSSSVTRSEDAELEAAYADLPVAQGNRPQPDSDRRDAADDSEPDAAAVRGPSTISNLVSRMFGMFAQAPATIPALGHHDGSGDVEPDDDHHADGASTVQDSNRPGLNPAEVMDLITNGRASELQNYDLVDDAAAIAVAYESLQSQDEPPRHPPQQDVPVLEESQPDHASTRVEQEPRTEADQQARLQHHLAGAGITSLKSYMGSQSSTADVWALPEGERLLNDYATKLKQLKSGRMKDFILKYSLPQGTSADVKARIEARMG